MATLALSLAGQAVGGLVGGPIGATVGRALGALAGSAIDGLIFGEDQPVRPASDVRLQGSSEGGGVPRIYGWNRLSGNIIWATELETIAGESTGAKAMGGKAEEEIAASFAVAFCEGAVQRLGRIWADGQLLDTEGLTLRFYSGSETQQPDGLIEALQGADAAPAYRGTCYIVFERLPLGRFGNRIPNISVELCRVVGELEPQIRAVTVIPGATEFGYDPEPRVRIVGPGATVGENAHVGGSLSDWTVSVDELTALCPNLQHVALVVAWFGDDLRCGECAIGPRVEAASRAVDGATWSVMGLGRGDVPVVSSHEDGPAYGGTPSDAAVRAAIADLKARGLEVTVYPFILMDVPEGNSLVDPHTGAVGQPAYPWRGRITCDPAPGVAGTPDQTSAVEAPVTAFLNGGYRQMHLHYAAIAAETGADAMTIGSEMRGMTTLRGAGNGFPFVAALVELAADVRAVVGSGVKLTYAADWSEYSGYQPGGGEKFFHLDPLWASADIDAVGIDNYMPIADWRDGLGHADAALTETETVHDLGYLKGNIAAGEGFDWYYASEADRLAGNRTPITDGGYGEPFVWRFKDVRAWWESAHYDRPGGVRAAEPTAWVPGSKPIWFTELGCAAVDKGANQPNIFGDAKSAEGGRPYFSTGAPDALMQRQFLRAHAAYWSDPANNPQGMVDLERIYLWTWDARPYPAFPALSDVWADGENHHTGHWLTGRLGALAGDELAQAIAADHGIEIAEAEAQPPLIAGFQVTAPGTTREALEPLLAATGARLAGRADGISLARPALLPAAEIEKDGLAETEGALLSRRRPDPGEATGRLVLGFTDRERDYQSGSVTALRGEGNVEAVTSALALDIGGARMAAETVLAGRSGTLDTLDFSLPSSMAAVEIGDTVTIDGLSESRFEITEIRDGLERKVTARSVPAPAKIVTAATRPKAGAPALVKALPVVHAAHLPPLPEPARSRLVLAAYAEPWPGVVSIEDEATGATIAELTRRAFIGETVAPLATGPEGVWDLGGVFKVRLYGGHLADAGDGGALAGLRRVAVETDVGDWEVLGFAEAELTGPGIYRLTRLLRGQEGTGPVIGAVGAGNRVIVLDERPVVLPVPAEWLGSTVDLRVYGGSTDLTGVVQAVSLGTEPMLPLPPCHLRAVRDTSGDIALSWVRRSRADAGGWTQANAPLEHQPEAYVVSILDGSNAVRIIEAAAPSLIYTAAAQAADFGALPAAFSFTIAQVSPVLGTGLAAGGTFNG
jgi:hypothetical protein